MLSIEERIFLVEFVFRNNDKYTESVKDEFQRRFPQTTVPHRDTVRDLISKFRETGSVIDASRSGRPSKATKEKLEDISDRLLRSPSKSLRKLSQQSGLSLGLTHKVVRKELKLYPYKVRAVQELKDTDFRKRMEYCEWFNNFIAANGEDILDVTFFTDEAWFHLSGYINSQNSHLWSSENPNSVHESPLHSEKVGVWVAISRQRIIGPIFFSETVTAERYCNQILFPFIGCLNEDEISRAYFQQDNATAHTANRSLALLEEVFAERIISKGVWPARSPDLTPPDFYLWGAAKGNVYKNNPRNIDELKIEIQDYIQSVTAETLRFVFDNKIKRVNLCMQEGGKHFQHLL